MQLKANFNLQDPRLGATSFLLWTQSKFLLLIDSSSSFLSSKVLGAKKTKIELLWV